MSISVARAFTPYLSKPFVLILVLAGLLLTTYWDGLAYMANAWFDSPEYSHGVMIPFIAAFLAWQKWAILRKVEPRSSWQGFALVVFGLLLYIIGQLSALYVLVHYSFVIVLCGLVLTYWGWTGLKFWGMPLVFLVLMIPLPNFFYNGLSSQLQLLSSELGVSFIRACGLTVFLEGNVIDLGSMKLQVVEACNGLRYLFPLMAAGFILAYFFKAPWWQRLIVFISSIPITLLMNSLRIGLIGVTVEYFGVAAAEGFVHDFEGWLMFMVSFAVMLAEAALLARLSGKRLGQSLALQWPAPVTGQAVPFRMTHPLLASSLLIAVVGVAYLLIPARAEVQPERKSFTEFPLEISGWEGRQDHLDAIYIDALKFDDYLLNNYTHPQFGTVNAYVAYYASQRAGQSAHSPRSCIPGGGWIIDSIEQRILPMQEPGKSLEVNRVLVRKGNERQLVYYWFQQRGRVITNEYAVKSYLLWDAITRNRTDGALLRLTTRIAPGKDVAVADEQLTRFAANMLPQLPLFVPD